jgi:mono/diheme cytochrome c family protein
MGAPLQSDAVSIGICAMARQVGIARAKQNRTRRQYTARTSPLPSMTALPTLRKIRNAAASGGSAGPALPRIYAGAAHVILAGVIAAALSIGNARATDAQALWEKHCIQCHGPDGRGLTKMGRKLNIRDLTAAKVQEEITDENMRRNIKNGVKDATGKVLMKPAENVTDVEIDALVRHVRTLKAR